MSSTEAEFVAAADAGKIALYLRSMLAELGIPQINATILYKDNMGAYLMVSAGQPTPRTRHIEIKDFALQSWVERDIIDILRIKTSLNTSDYLTKSAPRIIFHRHNDINMGKICPKYLSQIQKCFSFPVLPSKYNSTPNAQQNYILLQHGSVGVCEKVGTTYVHISSTY